MPLCYTLHTYIHAAEISMAVQNHNAEFQRDLGMMRAKKMNEVITFSFS